jgi:hypothetical protein
MAWLLMAWLLMAWLRLTGLCLTRARASHPSRHMPV